MRLALAAASSVDSDDVPVGAVVVDESGAVVASAANRREFAGDPTAHAEVLALREAASVRGSWRLDGLTVVVDCGVVTLTGTVDRRSSADRQPQRG